MNIEGLIGDLALILVLGAISTIIFRKLKQPIVLGYIVAGFLVGPHFTYFPTIHNEDNIEFWAQIGIIVLLFSLGLEFSFKKLMNVGGSAIVHDGAWCGSGTRARLQQHQLPVSRRNALDVIDYNYNKGI